MCVFGIADNNNNLLPYLYFLYIPRLKITKKLRILSLSKKLSILIKKRVNYRNHLDIEVFPFRYMLGALFKFFDQSLRHTSSTAIIYSYK